MKILLMTSIFDPLDSGVGKHVTLLAESLSKQHEIIVISALANRKREQNGSGSEPKTSGFNSKNTKPQYNLVNFSGSITDKAKFLLWRCLNIWNPIAYWKIKKILDSEKPDIVHTHTIKRFSPSVFSAIKNSGIPHVHTLHDYELISPWFSLFRNGHAISKFNFLERIYIWYKMITSPGIDTVISPSQFAMDLHTKLGFFKNSKKYVIPNGTILDRNTTVKQNSGKEFLFIGRVTEYKGPHIVVAAFKKIKDKDARLHIVGKGDFFDAVKRMTNGDQRIIFHGFISNKADWDPIFERCSYLVFPSICYENSPLTIMEAMNRGLPVIGSNLGAIPELVKNGYNGFLFEAGNIDSLRSIIENVLNGKVGLPELSQNAIEYSKRLSVEENTTKISCIYSDILVSTK